MGEIRKYWFSRLIIDESPKKNVHNLFSRINFFIGKTN
eukprot:UN07585